MEPGPPATAAGVVPAAEPAPGLAQALREALVEHFRPLLEALRQEFQPLLLRPQLLEIQGLLLRLERRLEALPAARPPPPGGGPPWPSAAVGGSAAEEEGFLPASPGEAAGASHGPELDKSLASVPRGPRTMESLHGSSSGSVSSRGRGGFEITDRRQCAATLEALDEMLTNSLLERCGLMESPTTREVRCQGLPERTVATHLDGHTPPASWAGLPTPAASAKVHPALLEGDEASGFREGMPRLSFRSIVPCAEDAPSCPRTADRRSRGSKGPASPPGRRGSIPAGGAPSAGQGHRGAELEAGIAEAELESSSSHPSCGALSSVSLADAEQLRQDSQQVFEKSEERAEVRPWSSSATPRAQNMEALRAEHESMLVAEAVRYDSERCASPRWAQRLPEPGQHAGLGRLPLALLLAFAVLPPGRSVSWVWYRWVAAAAVGALALRALALAVLEPPGALYLHLTTALLALGGLAGLASLWARGIQEVLGPRNRPLFIYATARGFAARWAALSARRFAVVVALWALAVACRTVGSTSMQCVETSTSHAHLATFVVAHTLTALLLYCQLHLCSGFEVAIDNFFVTFFQEGNFEKGIYEWNLLQAMLRRAAGAVEPCFLAVGSSVLALMILTLREILNSNALSTLLQSPSSALCTSLWAGWVLPLAGLVFYAVFIGAVVTEKCLRAPAMVNAWTADEHEYIDHKRQYFVQYISQSSAGWYVIGVRVSALWASKVSYLFAAVVFTLVSQSLHLGLG